MTDEAREIVVTRRRSMIARDLQQLEKSIRQWLPESMRNAYLHAHNFRQLAHCLYQAADEDYQDPDFPELDRPFEWWNRPETWSPSYKEKNNGTI